MSKRAKKYTVSVVDYWISTQEITIAATSEEEAVTSAKIIAEYDAPGDPFVHQERHSYILNRSNYD